MSPIPMKPRPRKIKPSCTIPSCAVASCSSDGMPEERAAARLTRGMVRAGVQQILPDLAAIASLALGDSSTVARNRILMTARLVGPSIPGGQSRLWVELVHLATLSTPKNYRFKPLEVSMLGFADALLSLLDGQTTSVLAIQSMLALGTVQSGASIDGCASHDIACLTFVPADISSHRRLEALNRVDAARPGSSRAFLTSPALTGGHMNAGEADTSRA